MGRIWSEQRRFETWLHVETAAADAMAEAGIVPAEAARDLRERGQFDIARIDEIEQHHAARLIAFTTNVAEHVGPSGALAAFRPDLLRRRRHGAGAADARGVRSDPGESRRAAGGDQAARRGASADADDRPHARRACRADDVRAEAGAVVRGSAARLGAVRRARARSSRRQDLGRRRHVRAPRSGDRGGGLPAARARAGADLLAGHPARSSCRADDDAGDHSRRRSRSSRSRFAGCRRPKSAKSKSRSPRGRRARRRCRTSATRSAASRSSASRA